jgi:hypothetical protein
MREDLWIGGRPSWLFAWSAAVAGALGHLLRPDTVTWWLGMALAVPVIALAAWRADRRGDQDGVAAVGDSLPFGPP